MQMTAFLPLGLAFLMLVVGLRLTAADFSQLWRSPKAAWIGALAQVAGLPLLALAIARILALPQELALGLLVVAAAPGGITSNFMAVLARADVALSTTMTLGTSLLAAITIPLVLWLGQEQVAVEGGALALAIARTGLAVLAVSAIPLLAGMALRAKAGDLVARWSRTLDRVSTVIFFAIVLATFLQNGSAVVADAPRAGLAAILLNLGAIGLAFVSGRLAALQQRQILAIALECGLQNVAMALFIATSVLHDTRLVAPALVYAVVMNLTALVLVAFGRTSAANV
jgi:BASS family bile acid:Na+ symporter